MSTLERIRPRSFRDYQALPVLGPILDDFVRWSFARGSKLGSVKNRLKDCLRLSKFWADKRIVSWTDIPFEAFDDAYRYFHDDHPDTSGTARSMEEFLRDECGMPQRPLPEPTRSSERVEMFIGYLMKVRGLGSSTISAHRKYILLFMEHIGLEDGDGALAHLSSGAVDEFIAIRSKTLNRHSLQHLVGYLRSYLRFEFSRGTLPLPLHQTIDSPRIYRQEKLPRSLPWDTVKTLLEGIDRSDPQGKRNHLMLLMMATYGLRAVEIVSMTLDDIDWRGRTIHIPQGKTGNHLRLPLTDEVAITLIEYLKNARPPSSRREVFLRIRAPLTIRLKPTGVAEVFQREVRRSGLDIREQGVHCLRHSFAVHLLRQGTSMKTIGDILGHRSAESTCVYLRLAVEDLREVALDVPEYKGHGCNFLPRGEIKFLRIRPWQRKFPRKPFRSFLKTEIEAFLRLHHSLGKKFQKDEHVLYALDFFIVECCPGALRLDYSIFKRWCDTLSQYGATERRSRMLIVRKVSLYRQRTLPAAFIPDILTFPACAPKAPPFIIRPDEIGRLLRAIPIALCHDRYKLRQATIRLAVILLFTTGMRRGELLRLSLEDFNASDNTLFIRTTKFHKQRIIPLSDSAAKDVYAYIGRCGKHGFSMNPSSPLIRHDSPEGATCYTGSGLAGSWRMLCASAKLLTRKGVPPRIHDIRHSFAVNALLRWYENGNDPQAKLPQLATYMGHVSVLSTHYYLSFVEPLRTAASARFEKAFGNLTHNSKEGDAL